jgi:hypothetical protein
MPRHAPHLECAADVRDQLIALSKDRLAESRMVKPAPHDSGLPGGKEIQQVAQGLPDNLRPGKPRKYGNAFRDRWLKFSGATVTGRLQPLGGTTRRRAMGHQRARRLASAATRRNLPAEAPQLV